MKHLDDHEVSSGRVFEPVSHNVLMWCIGYSGVISVGICVSVLDHCMFDYPCFIYYIQLFESTLVWPVDVGGFLKSFSAQTYHVALDEALRH